MQKEAPKSVALIIGVTGLTGHSLAEILPLPDTPGGPWKVYGVSRRPNPIPSPMVSYIQCDVSDEEDARAKLSPLAADVTHVFFVAATYPESEMATCEVNERMTKNVLKAVVPHAPGLRHICLQSGITYYVGGGTLDSLETLAAQEQPFTEDMPRLDSPNYFYGMEDAVSEAARQNPGLTYSVNRPSYIFGFSLRSTVTIVGTLCVYAAICKHEGVALRFPGTREIWEQLQCVSDADLIAEQHIWAAVDPNAKNEAFQCTNGDLFSWKQLWPVLAKQFGIEYVDYFDDRQGRISLVETMKDKGKVWDEIVRENGLLPTKLEEVGHWPNADSTFRLGGVLDSMNKSKEHGFLGFRNTKTSFIYWIQKIRANKVIP